MRSDGQSECAFCDIASGIRGASELIASEARWFAIFPLEPATLGHTLVIPRQHVSDLWNVRDMTLASELVDATIRVGRAIKLALEPAGLNLISSAGVAAEQTVDHLHLHVVPRWRDDNFGEIWPAVGLARSQRLEDAAQSVRYAIKQV